MFLCTEMVVMTMMIVNDCEMTQKKKKSLGFQSDVNGLFQKTSRSSYLASHSFPDDSNGIVPLLYVRHILRSETAVV